jgi:hypothetical protein
MLSAPRRGRSTIIDILFHVAAERQHETKCRDVKRPEGAFDSHRLLDVMFRTPPKGGCETIIDILFHVATPRQHETKCRDVAKQQSSALRAVMLCGPKGRVTVIGPKGRDVERPRRGRSTNIDILFHVAAPRQHETKCRDVERPEGAFDSHRLLDVMSLRDNHRREAPMKFFCSRSLANGHLMVRESDPFFRRSSQH